MLNQCDTIPLPRTDDVLEALGSAGWFSCLDFTSIILLLKFIVFLSIDLRGAFLNRRCFSRFSFRV